ncbi:MAG: hypothetical protein OXF46_03670 [Rhodobacteraceae bacterium]|nr:hypothetical protein [Paracoccaceae bacterium]
MKKQFFGIAAVLTVLLAAPTMAEIKIGASLHLPGGFSKEDSAADE